jgi:hypothetical protein
MPVRLLRLLPDGVARAGDGAGWSRQAWQSVAIDPGQQFEWPLVRWDRDEA